MGNLEPIAGNLSILCIVFVYTIPAKIDDEIAFNSLYCILSLILDAGFLILDSFFISVEGFISFIHGDHGGLIKRDHGYRSYGIPGFQG